MKVNRSRIRAGREPPSKRVDGELHFDADRVVPGFDLEVQLIRGDAAILDDVYADRSREFAFVFAARTAQIERNVQRPRFPADGSSFEMTRGVSWLTVSTGNA